eukprot:CCRYP_018430-RA/>CCRYP_018430-RA protein AED:0.03 eAED:0.03 QI:0/0.5/0.66/1/0/0/3/1582/498
MAIFYRSGFAILTLAASSHFSPRILVTAFTPISATLLRSCRSPPSPPYRQITPNNGKRPHALFSTSSDKSPIREKIRYIAGRRALVLHPSTTPQTTLPPLVILGGMAQSISSWEFHLQHLCSVRSVMVYEALGQGPPPPSEVCSIDGSDVTLEQYYRDVTLERQGRDFWEVVDEAFYDPDSYYRQNFVGGDGSSVLSEKQVDVAGFSFGGRVAMAAATLRPRRIRRLHLTGVGAERDEYATVVLTSWKEILGAHSETHADSSAQWEVSETDIEEECDPELHSSRCTARLRAFAWCIILSTYSEQFLASAGPRRVQAWVDGVCRYNTEEGLKALLMQTHGSVVHEVGRKLSIESSEQNANLDLWTPASMAQRIKTDGCVESFRVVVGSQDKMASPIQALKLAQLLGLSNNDCNDGIQESESLNRYFRVIDGCGHAVPMEALKLWREDVLEFLAKCIDFRGFGIQSGRHQSRDSRRERPMPPFRIWSMFFALGITSLLDI